MNDQNIQSHRNLKVWQLGMQITEDVYSLTRAFPEDERFGLISQLRRATASVRQTLQRETRDRPRRNIFSFSQLQQAP